MSVDMFEWRFRAELEKLPKFNLIKERDERVWNADFPAWRALFTSLTLYGHSTGYRLPPYDAFFRYCKKAYCMGHPQRERFLPYFQSDLLPGMRQRVGVWYESGMAETYLYVCLVDVIEDKLKKGVVLYDPRADWKLKADLIVIINKCVLRVSAFFGGLDDRPELEARRDSVERERKRNTMESAHWGNVELDQMPEIKISMDEDIPQTVNGVKLFSYEAINRLLARIYKEANINGEVFYPIWPAR